MLLPCSVCCEASTVSPCSCGCSCCRGRGDEEASCLRNTAPQLLDDSRHLRHLGYFGSPRMRSDVAGVWGQGQSPGGAVSLSPLSEAQEEQEAEPAGGGRVACCCTARPPAGVQPSTAPSGWHRAADSDESQLVFYLFFSLSLRVLLARKTCFTYNTVIRA